MTTCASRGMSASIFVSRLPRETCTAPGILPRFTSLQVAHVEQRELFAALLHVEHVLHGHLLDACFALGEQLRSGFHRNVHRCRRGAHQRSIVSVRASASSWAMAPSGTVHWSAMWPNGMLARHGIARVPRHFAKDVGERALLVGRLLGNVGEMAERDAGQPIERAGEPQMREHSIDAIDGLVHVLEDENRAVERRAVRRAEERGDEREVATDQAPSRVPAVQHRGARRFAARLPARRHRGAQRRFAELGELSARRRSVKRDEAGARPDRGVQRGDVGVADERFRRTAPRVVVEPVEQAHRAVAATNAPDRIDGAISREAVEIVGAMFVAAGEISVALEHVSADDWLPSHRARRRERALEVVFVAERPRRARRARREHRAEEEEEFAPRAKTHTRRATSTRRFDKHVAPCVL